MSAMASFTLKSLSKNRARTIVSTMGVTLSCALLTAILLSVSSIQAGLLDRTIAYEGAWHAYLPQADDSAVNELVDEEWTESVVASDTIATVPFEFGDSTRLGENLAIVSMPHALKGSCDRQGDEIAIGPNVVEGRLPQSASEIALPNSLKGAVFDDADGEASIATEGELGIGTTVHMDMPDQASAENGRTAFTVVGFINNPVNRPGYCTTASQDGQVALVAAGQYESEEHQAWITSAKPLSEEELAGAIGTDASAFETHESLLRAMGRSDGSLTWTSVINFGLVLAGVVVLASISLIYNAFAISVAERTRQFGLLSSIGATRGQIRRSVLLEAASIGGIAIPVGLIAGTLGTMIVLSETKDAFSSAMGIDGGLEVTLEPAIFISASCLTAIVLLASAWIPSVRASRISTIEAIRQSKDVKMSKRAARKIRGSKAGSIADGMQGMLFGTPGAIARRNLSRSTSRGRSVVAALSISVALIVISGSVALYLDPIYNLANSKALGGQVDVQATLSGTRVDEDGETVLDSDDIAQFMTEAATVDGIEAASVISIGSTDAFIPSKMIATQGSEAAKRFEESAYATEDYPSTVTPDGSYAGNCTLVFLEEKAWSELASALGVDAERKDGSGVPNAIALNSFSRYDAGEARYETVVPFESTGQIALYDFEKVNEGTNPVLRADSTGLLRGYSLDMGDPKASEPELKSWPVDEISSSSKLNVIALADESSVDASLANAAQSFPTLIMPADSSADVFANAYYATASFKASEHAQAAQRLQEIAQNLSDNDVSIAVSDLAQSAAEYLMIVQAIELFINCFAVITMLIAVANVFNTMTNSVSLRKREFAVLKSIGMDSRSFAKMLALECSDHAVKGLAFGLLAASLATYGLYRAIGISFMGISFELPADSIAIAIALVVAVLGLSVSFALRKASRENIADTLRTDSF